MPRTSKRPRRPAVEHERTGICIEHFEARADASINHNLYQPQYAVRIHERDPVYLFEADLQLTGKATWPEDRAGDIYELAIHSEDSPSGGLGRTLADLQARDKSGARRYRQYRGREIPVFEPPAGMGLIRKRRGERRWYGWATVAPGFVQDALAILSQARPVYVSLHERRENRTRWVQGLTVQTIDPEIE